MGKRVSAELTEQRRDRIAELTRQGLTTREIAEIVGIHPRNVTMARKVRGLSQQQTPFTDAEKAQADAMLADGASIVEVARTLNRSSHTIHRYFPGRGWSRAQMTENIGMLRKGCRLLS